MSSLNHKKIFGKLYSTKTKYTLLFIVLISLFIINPLTLYFPFVRIIISLAFFAVVILSIDTLSLAPKTILTARITAIFGLICDLIVVQENEILDNILSTVSNLFLSLFISIAIVAISARVIHEKKINKDVIRGSICIYLMLGMLWFFFYEIIYIIDNNAFTISSSNDQEVAFQLFYFSFTTLTTLGYGDITPINHFAITLTNLEALMGQLFPAIVIAKLVSGYEEQ